MPLPEMTVPRICVIERSFFASSLCKESTRRCCRIFFLKPLRSCHFANVHDTASITFSQKYRGGFCLKTPGVLAALCDT